MQLNTAAIDMETNAPTVIMNKSDAAEIGANPLDRVQINTGEETLIGVVEVTSHIVGSGTLGITKRLNHLDGPVEVTMAPRPDAVRFIRKKLDGEELDREEINAIIQDINENRLSDVELGAYVSAIYTNTLSMEETINLTEAMTRIGESLEWDEDIIADKHSIGGVAGNRVTPIVIPIIAAAGIKIPKTSSRAITSPAGTADTMEVLCDVEFTLDEIREIVDETNGCMVWGGSVNLSPVDDKIIRAENPLSLDPEGQVIASVLSKKKAAGATNLVIDIPYGEGSKVESLVDARDMAKEFKRVGKEIGIQIDCTITRGSQPIGNGIGPVLEARDVLRVLNGDGPEDLKLKSLRLASILLESCGSDEDAEDLLASGAALDAFKQIIAAQNGDPDVTPEDLEPGEQTADQTADQSGIITHINNKLISEIARRAGAPKDAGAGIQLHHKVGDTVSEGDLLYRVYAEKQGKLDEALRVADATEPIRVRSKQESLVERV